MGFINLGKQLFAPAGIPADCDVVFVADMFASDYAGGAELTTEALVASSPLRVHRIRSRDVTMQALEQGYTKHWVFGNFADLDRKLIPSICANMKYSVIEYDYKFCRYRSPEKHLDIEKASCACDNEDSGKLVSAFLYGAQSLWWMSERQQGRYFKMFPFLREKKNTVLSSVFDDRTFALVKLLRSKAPAQRQGWVVMGSPSWIKGTQDAIDWCEEQGHPYETVWDLPYEMVLQKLSQAEGLVFLPKGGDTCPRMVIEAKLLGCKLHLNDNVEHRSEEWFSTEDMLDTEAYLYLSRDRFWNGIKADMDYRPSISGYTTTKDCVVQDYPFEESISSMLGFCDEVVIVDGGSTDGTWERLQSLAASDGRVVIYQQKRDWSHPRFAVFDGAQKALARSLCTGQLCWQQDSDEVVHEDDYQKVRDVAKLMPKSVPILSLPVIEYWGGPDKVRVDVNVWKWRLSQNSPTITHGIPDGMRQFDAQGELFSKPGCDGCWYVKHDTYEMMPAATFFTPDMEQVRQAAMTDPKALGAFEAWFNTAVTNLPSVHHFSWFNIRRKMDTYRGYWSRHWTSLHDQPQDDTAANNMFFDKPWSEVTADEMDETAAVLGASTGGHVFHRKWDPSRPMPSIRCNVPPPKLMEAWMERNRAQFAKGVG